MRNRAVILVIFPWQCQGHHKTGLGFLVLYEEETIMSHCLVGWFSDKNSQVQSSLVELCMESTQGRGHNDSDLFFLPTWINLIPVGINHHMPSRGWNEITSPPPNLIEVWEWISNFFPHFIMQWLIHVRIKVNPYYKTGAQVMPRSSLGCIHVCVNWGKSSWWHQFNVSQTP